ncbi:MAG: hypothetical protein HQL97_05825 [Magnetococcales bacterium]|nr:hypothetical protein [Magnetococcales bacterium]
MNRSWLPVMSACLILGAGSAVAEERITAPGNGAPAAETQPASSGIKLGSGFTLNPNVTVLNDYVSRGITNNKHNPVVQGTAKITHDASGLYASLFASNVRFIVGPGFDSPYMELDPSIGWSREIQGINVDLGFVHYAYPGGSSALKFYYDEYYLSLGHTFANQLSLNGKYYYSPSFSGSLASNSANYLDLSASYPLPAEFKIAGHYGRSWGNYFEDAVEGAAIKFYSDYSLSLSKEVLGMNASLAWTTTDHRAKVWQAGAPGAARDQVVLGLSKDF